MKGRLVGIALIFGCLIYLSACKSSNGTPESSRAKAPESVSALKGKDRAIVFVHGIHGSIRDTWQVPNGGPYWPDLLKDDPAFQDADVVVKGYPTPYTGNKSDVNTIADALAKDLQDVFGTHKQVVFICHSLGGLIVKQMLLDRPAYAEKVPFMVFYATPHAGSFLAHFFSVFAGDPLLQSMSSSGGNAYLLELENRWREKKYPIHRYCAYMSRSRCNPKTSEQS